MTRTTLPNPLPAEGVPFDCRATFESLRFLPRWMTLGHNNLRPRLHLYPDRIEIRTLGTSTIALERLARVDAFSGPLTHNIAFYPRGRITRFSANLRNESDFLALLSFLSENDAPLTERSRRFLA